MCGNEKGPCRLIYLDALSPVGGNVWEELRGVALLEEVCYGDGFGLSICH